MVGVKDAWTFGVGVEIQSGGVEERCCGCGMLIQRVVEGSLLYTRFDVSFCLLVCGPTRKVLSCFSRLMKLDDAEIMPVARVLGGSAFLRNVLCVSVGPLMILGLLALSSAASSP